VGNGEARGGGCSGVRKWCRQKSDAVLKPDCGLAGSELIKACRLQLRLERRGKSTQKGGWVKIEMIGGASPDHRKADRGVHQGVGEGGARVLGKERDAP